MLTIECPECGKIHKFSVDGVVEKGTIYCGCGRTIIIDNANQFREKIEELERPSPQVALSTKAEKKEEKVEKPKEEKPKTEKPKAEKPKTVKPKTAKAKEEKPKAEKPKEKKTRKKKSTKEEAKK
jgi:hypothetical protein